MTPSEHPDYAPLQQAHSGVERIATMVNEAVKRREAVEQVVQLQHQFDSTGRDLAKPGRFLIRQGSLTCQPLSGTEKNAKACVCVLFNDGLLLAEKNTLNSKLSLVRLVPPELISGVDEDPANACALRVMLGTGLAAGSSMHGHSMHGGHSGPLGKESFSAVAPSGGERDAWIRDLEQLGTVHDLQGGQQRTAAGAGPSGAKAGGARAGGPGGGSGVLAGWLKKKGGGGAEGSERNWAKGGRRNWKKRWVVVTTTQFISWYTNQKCEEMKGSMSLLGAQVVA